MQLPRLSPGVIRRSAGVAVPVRVGISASTCVVVTHCSDSSTCPGACPICYNGICHSCGQIACTTPSDCPSGCPNCSGNYCAA